MSKALALAIMLLGGEEGPDQLRIYPAVAADQADKFSLPFKVAFKNVTMAPQWLLDKFKPIPIFFTVSIVHEDGTVIGTPGSGKIAMDEMNFIPLQPGETFSIELDAASVLSAPLEPGRYRLSLEYHNQYGNETSFTGYLDSNTVVFEVAPRI